MKKKNDEYYYITSTTIPTLWSIGKHREYIYLVVCPYICRWFEEKDKEKAIKYYQTLIEHCFYGFNYTTNFSLKLVEFRAYEIIVP